MIKSAGPLRAESSRDQKGLCAHISSLRFSGRLLVPSPGRPTGPSPPGSRTPTSQGAGWALGGLNSIFCSILGPSSPSVTSQTPRTTASPKAPLFCPGEQASSSGEPPRSKVARTPAHTTTPVQVVTHPTSLSPPTASSPN